MTESLKSCFALSMENYIVFRAGLGYTNAGLRGKLRHFDRYAQRTLMDFTTIDPMRFLEFRNQLQGTASTINNIISAIRGYFDYLLRCEIIQESNPLKYLPGLKVNAFIPFVFSEAQIEQLLCTVSAHIRKEPTYFLKDYSAYMALMLMARSGMRISEPLRLKFDQYRKPEGTVYIEKTKLKKSRLIPLPLKSIAELDNYIAVKKNFGVNSTYLLHCLKGRSLSNNSVYKAFHNAVGRIGIVESLQTIGNTTFGCPTPHSLRHSFAINTLKQIRNREQSSQEALPVLMLYMGHSNYSSLQTYLKVRDAEHRQELFDVYRQMER